MTGTLAPSTGSRLRRHRPPSQRHSRGQAIIWLLGTLAASAAVMYGVYNVGMLTSAKAKTVNAADAAALAGATTQARLLNLMAYNNRAMMANEVFLIQMLSMESWLGYAQTTARNLETVLRIAGAASPPLQVAAQTLRTTSTAVRQARNNLGRVNAALIGGFEASKRAFAVAHRAAQLVGAALAHDAAASVVQASRTAGAGRSDPGFRQAGTGLAAAISLENQAVWANFTRQYAGPDRQDARQVLLMSRDEFSTSRPGQAWLNFSVLCTFGLEKQGGSRLVGFTRWETQDTLEVWTRRRLCSRRHTPVGWGRTNAAQPRSAGTVWAPARGAQRLAWDDGRGRSHGNWSGVPSLFDVSDQSVDSRADLGIDFLFAVHRPQANTLTSRSLGMAVSHSGAAGASNMDELLAGDQLSAFAKGRTFFERPSRSLVGDFTAAALWRPDQAKEYGSLYSPYWQARLTDVGASQKGILAAAMGLDPRLIAVSP